MDGPKTYLLPRFISPRKNRTRTPIIPNVSTPFQPQDKMPEEAKHPLVESYIEKLQSGQEDVDSIEPNSSISQENRHWKTMTKDHQICKAKDGNPQRSPIGYIWKELSDDPIVVGITKGVLSDHAPHFHSQPECYYAVKGWAPTLTQGKYAVFKKGQYLYIPRNTIHNTPITDSKGFSVLYWFPKSRNFTSIKYHTQRRTKGSKECRDAFQQVDMIRQRDLSLGPYGSNHRFFKNLTMGSHAYPPTRLTIIRHLLSNYLERSFIGFLSTIIRKTLRVSHKKKARSDIY